MKHLRFSFFVYYMFLDTQTLSFKSPVDDDCHVAIGSSRGPRRTRRRSPDIVKNSIDIKRHMGHGPLNNK